MHTVVVLALPDTIAFDATTPIELFGQVRLADGEVGYQVLVCGNEPTIDAGPIGLTVNHDLEALRQADTVVVPGRHNPTAPVPATALEALCDAANAGTRILSLHAGTFTLAAAGLLNGQRATTHWTIADQLRTAFPTVHVEPNVLYIDDGQIVTSAGGTAAIDACLHLIRRDYGAAVAAESSRLAVTATYRDGNQPQHHGRPTAEPTPPALSTTILPWLESHAARNLTLTDIASKAGLSVRTLNRRFHEETGRTPMQWVKHTRIRQAQALLQTTDYSVNRIAYLAGFQSPAQFRVHFKRVSGMAPQQYRSAYRAYHPNHRLPSPAQECQHLTATKSPADGCSGNCTAPPSASDGSNDGSMECVTWPIVGNDR